MDDAGDKQFSRPPSAQSFYSVQTSHTDQGLIPIPASRPATANSNNNSLTSPHKRNSPLSNGPQTLPPLVNRKMHEQPPAFGRQNLPTTVQTQTPHLFQSSSAANQDLRPTNVTTLNGNNMIGASSTPMGIQPSTAQGTPQSDRLEVDLPPEFALFHVSYLLSMLDEMRRAPRICLLVRLILRFRTLRENLFPLFFLFFHQQSALVRKRKTAEPRFSIIPNSALSFYID